MGNWRNRPPRRFFYSQNKAPFPSYDSSESPPHHSTFVDDGVPAWEKKFCSDVGLVPWRKVVDSKKFMYCHTNILNWNDSAGEESFHSAKKRFWSEINGLPCDISLPDPDVYIDKINWNPYVDPELVKDLEQALFVPDEEEKDSRVSRRNKRRKNFAAVSSKGCYRNNGDMKSPLQCGNYMAGSIALKDEARGGKQQDADANNSSNVNKTKNPWEQVASNGDTTVKWNTWGNSIGKVCEWNHSGNAAVKGNAWRDSGDEACGWNLYGNHVDQSRDWDNRNNPWEHSCGGNVSRKDCRGNIWNGSWSCNQQDSRKLNNSNSAWESSLGSCNGTPKGGGWADRGWRDNGTNSRGWKQWNNHGKELQSSGGDGNWKRERSRQNVGPYKSTRFRGDDYYHTGDSWRGEKGKRVSFA